MNLPPVILVANFAPDAQQSMLRLAELFRRELAAAGVAVELVAPLPRLTRLCRPYRYSGWPKLLGYADKFLFFPRVLRRLVRARPDAVFHIVDHANAVYLAHLPRRTVVTCNDLLQIRSALGEIPENRVGWSGRRYQHWIRRHLARAPWAASISGKTCADLRRLTGLPPERTPVIPLPLNFDYHRLDADRARALVAEVSASAAHTAFLLNVGGGQWYKNRPGLLRIFHALRTAHGYAGRLIMVGKPLAGADAALAAQLGLADAIEAPRHVSNEQLAALYSAADGLVFPSLEEGFGWPSLEAQACGCRVFTSNRPPMTEVGGDGAVYFDPADPAGAAATIAQALRGTPVLNERGLANARRFTTAAMVAAYLELYRRAAQE